MGSLDTIQSPFPRDLRWAVLALLGAATVWLAVLPWAPGLAVYEVQRYGELELSTAAAGWAGLLAVWIPIGAWITAAIVLLTILAMVASARQRRVPTALVFSVFVAASVELISVVAIWLLVVVTEQDQLEGSPWRFVLASIGVSITAMWLWWIGRKEQRRAADELARVEREQHEQAADMVAPPTS